MISEMAKNKELFSLMTEQILQVCLKKSYYFYFYLFIFLAYTLRVFLKLPFGKKGKIFLKLKKRIRDDRLTLANLHFEQRQASKDLIEMARFEYKGPVIEDETISPKRIICVHEESVDESLEEFT